MSDWQVVSAQEVAAQRWRNGGGWTRELLAWPADATTPDIEAFVGVVRGRTANSSR